MIDAAVIPGLTTAGSFDIADEPTTLALLVVAAFAAGMIDAIVGGGGLIQLPALLLAFPQAAPLQILATNKLASVAGTAAASFTYLRRVRLDRRLLVNLVPSAFLGALLGAALASRISRDAFDPVVLVALLVVGGYVVWRPDFGASPLGEAPPRRAAAAAWGIGLLVGCYDGALGPGTGSFFVVGLIALTGAAFLQASAAARVANLATNLAALIVFVPQGAVLWSVGLAMAAANIVGGRLGARLAIARGSAFVRIVLLIVVAALAARIGVDIAAQRNG